MDALELLHTRHSASKLGGPPPSAVCLRWRGALARKQRRSDVSGRNASGMATQERVVRYPHA